jgi:phage baseplate assembly protein W
MAIRTEITPTIDKKKDIFFSDFLNNFNSHPNGGNLVRITNEDSVKQSIKNLVLTNYKERLFQPNIGGNVRASLFELIDSIGADFLKDSIKQTIKNNESRIRQIEVDVKPYPELNQYNVTIQFSINNSITVSTVDLILKRVR